MNYYKQIYKQKQNKKEKNTLKQQVQDDKEKLECSVCKRMVQRNCMREHQKTPTCNKKGLL